MAVPKKKEDKKKYGLTIKASAKKKEPISTTLANFGKSVKKMTRDK